MKNGKNLLIFFISRLNIHPSDDVLEVGCGSGAFLNEIKHAGSFSGVDYADDAIVKINSVMCGDFRVSEASKLPFNNSSFDIIISFSVFFYFDSFAYASKVIDEMLRTLKPNGKIFIGEINDIEKKDLALRLRAESEEKRNQHRVYQSNIGHLYYDISFFEDIAKKKGLDLEIINQDVPELSFYDNAPYRFSVIFKHKGNL